MRANSKQLSKDERKALIDRVISECELLAKNYVKNWQPINPDWKTVEGCAYLRLSDDDQVLVEKGSLEQQINIAVSEALIRSEADHINYKISVFYIEPGITGTHDRRPQFQLMKKNIRLNKHKFVVIKEIARMIRDLLLWKELFKLCHEMQCEIFIRGLPFNPNDPTQVLQLDFLAMLAEYESKLISKRLKESVFAAIVSSGKFNLTHKVLGLDQLKINGEDKVGSPEEAKKFQKKYRVDSAGIEKEIERCCEAIHAIQSQRNDVQGDGFDWKHLTERAEHIQQIINENDPEALRVAYAKLFAAVIVGDIDKRGVRPLIFALRGGAMELEMGVEGPRAFAERGPVNLLKKNCIYENLAQAELFIPPTSVEQSSELT